MIDLNQCLNTLNHECYKSHGLRGFVGRVGPLGAVGVVCPVSPVGSYTNPWVPLVSEIMFIIRNTLKYKATCGYPPPCWMCI